MSKKYTPQQKPKNEGRVQVKKTPSPYGSHSSMVVEAPDNLKIPHGYVVCQDELGLYFTPKKSLDTGLADPNRFRGDRL